MDTDLIDPETWKVIDDDLLQRLRREVAADGFASCDQALDPKLISALQAEARAAFAHSVTAEDDGSVSYRAKMGNLGPVGKAFLSHTATTAVLDSIFEGCVTVSENASCYTFYAEGDHLGLHQDRSDSCHVTLILYLEVNGPSPRPASSGLELRVYGCERPAETEAPKVIILTYIGRVVVGRGAKVWHERPRLAQGEQVMALTSCFTLQRP